MGAFAFAQTTASKTTTSKATAAKTASTNSTGAIRKYAKSTAAAKSTVVANSATNQAAVKGTTKPSATAKSSTAPKTATASASSSAKHSKGKTGAKPSVASYHPLQQQPTPDRYKEIQQALQDRGYFAGPADGNWGPSSSDALKRFQHDQNLTEDGKIGSLSLIALGLGPKRAALPQSTIAKPASPHDLPVADSPTGHGSDPQTSQPAGQSPAETEPQ